MIGAVFLIWYMLYHIIPKRMCTIKDLPEKKYNYTFDGIVTSVGDGDGFQVFHVPWFASACYDRNSEKLPIRLAGIDAPEVRSYGNPAQPKSREAKKYLTRLIHKKVVRVRVLNIDMYDRIIAIVHVRMWFFFWINVNEKMLEAGLACVYDRKGAAYGGHKYEFILAEQKAKANRLGMWESSDVQLPMDFKYKCKQEAGTVQNGGTERRGSNRFEEYSNYDSIML